MVLKVDIRHGPKKAMLKVWERKLFEGQDDIRSLSHDDKFVYALTDTAPGRLVKLDKVGRYNTLGKVRRYLEVPPLVISNSLA
jgi:hypothetical protein